MLDLSREAEIPYCLFGVTGDSSKSTKKEGKNDHLKKMARTEQDMKAEEEKLMNVKLAEILKPSS